ncbi:hypothetical protein EON67_00465 [archaeon]|nr:MAG: hypothetical protein EON67_00465 [archaeon]
MCECLQQVATCRLFAAVPADLQTSCLRPFVQQFASALGRGVDQLVLKLDGITLSLDTELTKIRGLALWEEEDDEEEAGGAERELCNNFVDVHVRG